MVAGEQVTAWVQTPALPSRRHLSVLPLLGDGHGVTSPPEVSCSFK